MKPRPLSALTTSRRLAAGTLVAAAALSGGIGVELAQAKQQSTTTGTTTGTTTTSAAVASATATPVSSTGDTSTSGSSVVDVAPAQGAPQARTSGS